MFHRILLAVDDTDSGETGIAFATALATQSAAPVRVVHVNQLLVGGRGFTEETMREATALVDGTVGQLREAGIEATGITHIASPFNIEKVIVDEARAWTADVIVLGSRRRRNLGPFRRQGVRDRVLGSTHLPVLTAPPPLTGISEHHILRSFGGSVAKRLHAHTSS